MPTVYEEHGVFVVVQSWYLYIYLLSTISIYLSFYLSLYLYLHIYPCLFRVRLGSIVGLTVPICVFVGVRLSNVLLTFSAHPTQQHAPSTYVYKVLLFACAGIYLFLSIATGLGGRRSHRR